MKMKNTYKVFGLRVIPVLVSLLLCVPLFAEEVGTVVSTQGRVDIFKAGSETALPIREDEPVSVGDSIRTKSGAKAEIAFKDKSILRLAQNSRILIKDYSLDENKRRISAAIELSRGKARAIIEKMPDSSDFVITTPNAKGSVRGSDITAFYQAGNSGMFVTEGKMSLVNLAHPEDHVTVNAGNAALVPLEELPKGPRPYLDTEKKVNEEDTNVPVSLSKTGNVSIIKGAVAKVSGIVKIIPFTWSGKIRFRRRLNWNHGRSRIRKNQQIIVLGTIHGPTKRDFKFPFNQISKMCCCLGTAQQVSFL
jgi:hypothetical protein